MRKEDIKEKRDLLSDKEDMRDSNRGEEKKRDKRVKVY
jgi:hypothetical protein